MVNHHLDKSEPITTAMSQICNSKILQRSAQSIFSELNRVQFPLHFERFTMHWARRTRASLAGEAENCSIASQARFA